MPDAVAVVVPLLTKGCPHRQRAWEFCRDWWDRYPYSLVVSQGGEPWIKAIPVHRAIESTSADIIVIADADVVCDGVAEAVQAVQGGAAWARPHMDVVRLSDTGTEAYIAGEDWSAHPLDRLPYVGMDGGGIVVARRETFLEIPLDPRFIGWGNEDWAWNYALTTTKGKPWRGEFPLIHLFHPPEPRDVNRKHGSPDNQALWQRYHDARAFPDKMAQLIQEARVSLATDESNLHGLPARGVGSR